MVEKGGGAGKYVKITDRAEAIEYALDHMQKGDILLLLGKGHEHFNESERTKKYISASSTASRIIMKSTG